MGKYLKKFETTADYTTFIATDYDKPNVSYVVEENVVHYNPIRNDIITYKATAKLTETTNTYSSGLHTNAFSGTNGQQLTMTSHTFDNGVGTIEFDGDIASAGNHAFSNCSSLTNIDIPDSVTSIGDSAFYGCSRLTSIDIPNGVTSIGEQAFYGCSGLTSVDIPSGAIGSQAFQYCSGITSVTIGSGVTSIGNSAFTYCSTLKSVTCSPTTPPTLGSSAFDSNAYGRKIYVPSASVNSYKAASGWSTYASSIQAIQ